MKVGLVTLYNYNFGSALQCYATQEYLSGHFCECELIEKSVSSNRIFRIVKTGSSLVLKIISHPSGFSKIMLQFRSQRSGSLKISQLSKNEIRRFVLCEIKRREYSNKELIKKANSSEYDFFLCGSDQVWNGGRVENYGYYFLRFAPKEKRIAWAPSFGGKGVETYNEALYRKYINDFRSLSVREESATDYIKKITGRTPEILCDPVMLFSGEEWRKKYNYKSTLNLSRHYVCLFFIDEVSDNALSLVSKIIQGKKYEVISFGYNYKQYDKFEGHTHYDGSPFDFLNVIDNAEIVFTDSYHATVFSILFKTTFYSFTRNYTHKQNQSSRLIDLLANTGLSERYDSSSEIDHICFDTSELYFTEQRRKSDEYLEGALGVEKHDFEYNGIALINRISECCGCGACEDSCPKKAITMVDMNGCNVPSIDRSICIKCGKCIRVCGIKNQVKNSAFKDKAYIAVGAPNELIRKSASGGMFASIARYVLKNGGIVYGASLEAENNTIVCKHIRIDQIDELYKLQGSKYVQCDSRGVFKEVENDLKQKRLVLFSGTSCQVASLRRFFSGTNMDTLITVDLICHGVMKPSIFNDYINYIEAHRKGKVTQFSFRLKDKSFTPDTPYVINTQILNKNGKNRTYYYPLRDSAYYRLFMSMTGYRESCYDCKYSSIKKPSDITLGDYYIGESKSKYIKGLHFSNDTFYSCMITHSIKGEEILRKIDCQYTEIPTEDAIEDHEHLKHSSLPTNTGITMLKIYQRGGFKKLQDYLRLRNGIVDIVRLFRN